MDTVGVDPQQLLANFPYRFMIVDDIMMPVMANRKAYSTFGVRPQEGEEESLVVLKQRMDTDEMFIRMLSDSMLHIRYIGDENRFRWNRQTRIYEVSVSLLSQAEDQRTYAVFFDDVTEQVTLDAISRDAREHLESILNTLPVGVIVLNRDVRVIFLNRAQEEFFKKMAIQSTMVDTIGMPISALLPETHTRWVEEHQRVLDDGSMYTDPKCVCGERKDLVLSVVIAPLRDIRGKTVGTLQISEDVTEKTRLEENLLKAEKLATVGQLAITVNHEINNPLTSILANSQILRLTSASNLDAKTIKRLEEIERQVERIAKVTEQLRSLDELKTEDYIAGGPRMIDIGLDKG
ncbi:MAG: PAS domain-containing protein [Candidatus Latescibacteria bacterium]|nr:PAS domain-containing protein [Candidatus Latescibacterota bacterium]